MEGDEKIGKEAPMRRRRTVVHFVGHWREAKPFQMMERETGIQPATNSLEEYASIINKQWRLRRRFHTHKTTENAQF
jgi:hypothetical protein